MQLSEVLAVGGALVLARNVGKVIKLAEEARVRHAGFALLVEGEVEEEIVEGVEIEVAAKGFFAGKARLKGCGSSAKRGKKT